MQEIFIATFIITLLRTIQSNVALMLTMRWYIKANVGVPTKQIARVSRTFVVVLPLLREQTKTEETVKYFRAMNYPENKLHLILVTTEKEVADARAKGFVGESTMDIAKELAQDDANRLVHLHYPDQNGKMVHQLNMALGYVARKYQDSENTFVAIYNADSRPHPDTFEIINAQASESNLQVFQQSSLYFSNVNDIKRKKSSMHKAFLLANAALQSRWTLANEVPRFWLQSQCLRRFKTRFLLAHCVGHGLFLRADLFGVIHELPSVTVTEDLFSGYILSAHGIPINPVPVLESADTPTTIKAALKQKYVWFFGPLDHYNYEEYFVRYYKKLARRPLLKWLTFQGLIPAVVWLLTGWVFLYLLLYSIFVYDLKLLLSSVALFVFYGPISFVAVMMFARKLGLSAPLKITDFLCVAIFSLPVIVVHGIPPLFTLYAKIRSMITKIEPDKPKTE